MTIAGDLNGNQPSTKIIGTHSETWLYENGRELRDFETFNNLKETNTFFHKKDVNKYNWSARGLTSQVLDTHVFRGYGIYTDPYLVVSEIKIRAR